MRDFLKHYDWVTVTECAVVWTVAWLIVVGMFVMAFNLLSSRHDDCRLRLQMALDRNAKVETENEDLRRELRAKLPGLEYAPR